mgnify:CR=1 FL=1
MNENIFTFEAKAHLSEGIKVDISVRKHKLVADEPQKLVEGI